MKQFIFDLWLGFGLLGMAVGLAAPIAALLYILTSALVSLLSL